MSLKDAQEFYSLVKDSAPESGDSPAGYKISDTFSDFAPQTATNNGYFWTVIQVRFRKIDTSKRTQAQENPKLMEN